MESLADSDPELKTLQIMWNKSIRFCLGLESLFSPEHTPRCVSKSQAGMWDSSWLPCPGRGLSCLCSAQLLQKFGMFPVQWSSHNLSAGKLHWCGQGAQGLHGQKASCPHSAAYQGFVGASSVIPKSHSLPFHATEPAGGMLMGREGM